MKFYRPILPFAVESPRSSSSSGNEFTAFFFILNRRASYPSPATQTHVIIGSFNVTWADARIITKVRSADSAEKRNIDSALCRIGRIFPCDARRRNAPRDTFSIHAANTAYRMQLPCTTVGFSGRPVATIRPPSQRARLFVFTIDLAHLPRIPVNSRFIFFDFSLSPERSI